MKTALALVVPPILSIGLIYSGEAAPTASTNLSEETSIGDLAPGSEIIVGDNPIIISANTENLYFQKGSFTQHVDKDETFCGLKLRGPAGHVRELAPGRTMMITSTAKGKELNFEHDPAVAQLWCTAPQGYGVNIGTFKFEARVLFKVVAAEIPTV
jgi:hypothetical protein